MLEITVPTYLPIQEKVFSDPHKFIMLAKGRRCGGTFGAAMYCIINLLDNKKILWVDTIQANLSRYMERYFIPVLTKIPNTLWDWNEQKKVLKIGAGYMDMRSAERPENLEGFGYDIIIMNEAGIIFNDNDSLWYNTIYPMTLDYNAKVIFIGTPKGKLAKSGKEHLYYTFYKKGLETDGDWKSYKASSYENPLLDPKDIQELEKEVPALIRQQEIYADFIDISLDSIFVDEWFHFTEVMPDPLTVIRRIISWDTAFKDGETNDFSVATVWIQTLTKYVCIDMYMGRLTFPKLIEKSQYLYETYKPDCVVIEDKASGQSLIQMFKQTTVPVIAFKEDRDKVSRAIAITPLMEQGKVEFLKNSVWNNTLKNQCTLFPLGEFDDAVDSMVQALLYMSQGSAWVKDRVPISKKIIRSSADLNGYVGQEQNVPVPMDESNLPPAYQQSYRPTKRDSILQGY
jgi:predicted phage terminase large subunit-like protein